MREGKKEGVREGGREEEGGCEESTIISTGSPKHGWRFDPLVWGGPCKDQDHQCRHSWATSCGKRAHTDGYWPNVSTVSIGYCPYWQILTAGQYGQYSMLVGTARSFHCCARPIVKHISYPFVTQQLNTERLAGTAAAHALLHNTFGSNAGPSGRPHQSQRKQLIAFTYVETPWGEHTGRHG